MGGGIRNAWGRPIRGIVPVVGGIASPGKSLPIGKEAQAKVCEY